MIGGVSAFSLQLKRPIKLTTWGVCERLQRLKSMMMDESIQWLNDKIQHYGLLIPTMTPTMTFFLTPTITSTLIHTWTPAWTPTLMPTLSPTLNLTLTAIDS